MLMKLQTCKGIMLGVFKRLVHTRLAQKLPAFVSHLNNISCETKAGSSGHITV